MRGSYWLSMGNTNLKYERRAKKQQRRWSFNNSFIFNKSNYPHIWDKSGRENLPKSFTAVHHRSTECVRVCIIHCNVAVTTKAATLVLECKRKPTRQSLSLESCQRLRHLPINWTPAVFFAAGAYFLTAILFLPAVPLQNDVCVSPCAPHWGIKWQAGSIKTDLIVRWRDSAECFRMCWCCAHTIKPLQNKSQEDEGGWWRLRVGTSRWGSHAKFHHWSALRLPAAV